MTVHNKLIFLSLGIVSLSSNSQARGSPLVRCHDCLFHILAASLHICKQSSPFATRERAMPLWQGLISLQKKVLI